MADSWAASQLKRAADSLLLEKAPVASSTTTAATIANPTAIGHRMRGGGV
jgi:hypothetical protein